MTETRVCAYEPCSKQFVPTHPRHRFCEPTCRANQHYADNPEKGRVPAGAALLRVAEHPLDEVRNLLEEFKGDWTLIVREHARRTLLATGYLSARDFESLGIPDEHHNVPNAQIGGWAGARYIEAVAFKRWSAEEKASRKSGKYWIYRITQLGREKLAGAGATGHVSPGSGEGSGGTAAVAPPASPEPARLLDRQPVGMASNSAFSPENEWA